MFFKCGTGKKDGTAIKVGNGAGTYDISKLYSDYGKLTSDNFILGFGSAVASIVYAESGGKGASATASPAKSYNPETGILTVSIGQTVGKGSSGDQVRATANIGDIWLVIE